MDGFGLPARKVPELIVTYLKVMIVIFVVETVIMKLLPLVLPAASGNFQNFADSVSLTALSAPFIWVLVARPFRTAMMDEISWTRVMLENIVNAVVVFGQDGIIMSVNPAAERMFGYEHEELVGRNIWQIIPALEDDGHAGFRVDPEVSGCCKNGGIFPLQVSISQIARRGRKSFVAIILDISDRKRAEQALQVQKDFSLKLLEDSAVPCFVLAPDHTVIVWNKACEKLTGMSAKEVMGTNGHWKAFYGNERPTLADIVLDGDAGVLPTLYGRYCVSVLSQDGLQSEGWFSNLGGKDRYIFFDAVPVRNARGEVVAAIETLEDITERQEYERLLLNSRAELTIRNEQLTTLFELVEHAKREWEQTMDCIDDMVVLLDGNGRVKRCNRAAAEFAGIPITELIGQEWNQLMKLPGNISPVIDAGCGFWEMYHDKLGRWLACSMYSYSDHNGIDSRDVVLTVHDVTEKKLAAMEIEKAYADLKEAHAQLIQQDKMASIGQLAAGVAHEINNPTGFIISNMGTLLKYVERLSVFIEAQADAIAAHGLSDVGELDDMRKRLKVDHIIGDLPNLIAESLDGAERIKRIAQNLKSFSRVDDAECKMTDLADCIENTVSIVWNELKYKVALKKEFGDLPPIRCYPQQLSQVFMNLLVNAGHAIEKQGEITIRTWQEQDSACISVADTGSGIPEAIRNRIFEPFFTTKEVGKGTGLGLSISHDIIRKHGGDMAVESEEGAGTTFIIKLPIGGERTVESMESGQFQAINAPVAC